MVWFVFWYGLGAKSQENRTKPYPVSIDTGIWYDLGAGGFGRELKFYGVWWFGMVLVV
jgi:hypothetical protein